MARPFLGFPLAFLRKGGDGFCVACRGLRHGSLPERGVPPRPAHTDFNISGSGDWHRNKFLEETPKGGTPPCTDLRGEIFRVLSKCPPNSFVSVRTRYGAAQRRSQKKG